MAVQIEFFEDPEGKKPLTGGNLGQVIIGKERLIYAKNTGNVTVGHTTFEFNIHHHWGHNQLTSDHFESLIIEDFRPGEIRPAFRWHPPENSEECSLEGNITIRGYEIRNV